MLQADLAKDKRWEQVQLNRGIVFVTTYEGQIVQFGHARLIWQVEPLKWMHGTKKRFAPFQQRKATYSTIRKLRDWLADPRNNPHIRGYFCSIKNRVMKKLAISFGMKRVYRGTEFFGEDL